jgi:formamidopyrimidine-DNA glycosylase
MPELPEVETTARDLRPHLLGQTITRAHVLWARTVAEPDVNVFQNELPGRRIIGVSRRGKYLVFILDAGAVLICHLRMTGRLRVEPPGSPALSDPHVRAWFELSDGRRLVFTDSRKFGRMWLVADTGPVLDKLGPEPLERSFDVASLGDRLHRRRVAIKALLLDQSVVAGLGNIYADEVLFRARIHPLRRAAGLTDSEIERLHAAIVEVLGAAIGGRGTTLRDYRPPFGERGNYQNELQVYQRTDQPCPRCGEPIQRIRVTQRSTHFCPNCQPIGPGDD